MGVLLNSNSRALNVMRSPRSAVCQSLKGRLRSFGGGSNDAAVGHRSMLPATAPRMYAAFVLSAALAEEDDDAVAEGLYCVFTVPFAQEGE